MRDYCDDCELVESCSMAYQMNFCEDCADRKDCSIRGVCCEAGYDIECNNGFEEEVNYEGEENEQ